MRTQIQWTADELLRYDIEYAEAAAVELWLRRALEFVQDPSNDREERAEVFAVARDVSESMRARLIGVDRKVREAV